MSIINLLPDDYIKRRAQQRANVLCLTLFLVVMTGVGGAALVSERSFHHTRQVAQRVNEAYAEATKLIDQLKQLEGQRQKMLHKAELTASLLERVPRSTLLAVVTNALPRYASLTRLKLIPRQIVTRVDPKPASASEAGTQFEKMQQQRAQTQTVTIVGIEVEGLAGTDVEVGRFIANLVRNPLLTGVDLVYSQEKAIGDYHVREFQVKMELKPNVDVMELIQMAKGQKEDAPEEKAEIAGKGAKS